MSQMLTESILLALLGGSAGILLGIWANRWIGSIHVKNIPLRLDSSLDWRVFIFAAASVLLAGIVVGILPALRASPADVNSILRQRPPGPHRQSRGIDHPTLRNLLVVAQVAGSLVLLVAAGLFVRSLQRVQRFDLGFDPENVLNVIMDPHEIGYDEARTTAFYRELEAKTSALPGVESASLASYVPMGGFPTRAPIVPQGHPTPPGTQAPEVLFNCIDPPYFKTMRISLLRGRNFADSDTASASPVAIINQTMANRFWPREDAIGKRFSMNGDTGPFAEVVGLTGDGKYHNIGEDTMPFFYVPLSQNFVSKRALQVRTLVRPESLAGPVKELVAGLAHDLSIMDTETMKQFLDGALGFLGFRLAATLAAVLGIIGLILAVVGVYGVVSFATSQKTRDIGIRIALGANSRDILNLVWLQAVRMVTAGVAIGITISWALTRSMKHLVVGISTSDPITYVAVSVLLLIVALIACYIPARRAMQVDPIVALRYE